MKHFNNLPLIIFLFSLLLISLIKASGRIRQKGKAQSNTHSNFNEEPVPKLLLLNLLILNPLLPNPSLMQGYEMFFLYLYVFTSVFQLF